MPYITPDTQEDFNNVFYGNGITHTDSGRTPIEENQSKLKALVATNLEKRESDLSPSDVQEFLDVNLPKIDYPEKMNALGHVVYFEPQGNDDHVPSRAIQNRVNKLLGEMFPDEE